MKSIILYAAPVGVVPDSKGYSAVQAYSRVRGYSSDTVFVRAEIVSGPVVDALVKARPRKGEVVLNTIPCL